jgi:hypothetical protein
LAQCGLIAVNPTHHQNSPTEVQEREWKKKNLLIGQICIPDERNQGWKLQNQKGLGFKV